MPPSPAPADSAATPLPWLRPGLVFALVSACITGFLAVQYRLGGFRWKTWEHEVRGTWEWLPFVHPPPFSAYMTWMSHASEATESRWSEGEILAVISALLVPPVVLLCSRLAADGPLPRRGVLLAAGLMAVSPTVMRPFEQYPVERLLLAGALVTLLLWARRGGRSGWIFAFLLCLGSVSFHLSSGFLLFPLLLLLGFSHPARRRGMGLLALLLLVLLGIAAQPGLFPNSLMDILTAAGVEDRSIFVPVRWSNLTFEYSNPVLYLPLLLWLHPGVRRSDPRGAAIAGSLVVYILVHLGLQQQGLAINSNAPEPHHYFELTEIAAIVATLWALGAAGRLWHEGPAKWVLRGALPVVLVSQCLLWLRVFLTLRSDA